MEMAIAKASLESVNAFRALYTDCGTLSWDGLLAEQADSWAQRGIFQHSTPKGAYGECLAIVPASTENEAIREAIRLWGEEETKFDRSRPAFTPQAGHFTQLVWKSSKKFGAGVRRYPDGCFLVVARFSPPGNVAGMFAEQVPRRCV
jgi:Cysteine-rich secretory protein family